MIALALLAPVGCGSRVPRGHDVDRELATLRHGVAPFYYAGAEFAGLQLTAAVSQGAGRAVFIYGTCKIPPGEDGGCAPPMQIQNFRFSERDWSHAYGCLGRPALRGVTTVRHDGLVLFSGRTVVKIYARKPSEDRRVALALRDLRAQASRPLLPPTAPAVRRVVSKACGRDGDGS